ncbi:MAG TPA: hypothetical protein VFC54_07960 [Pseudolabrys sp.]|nr:hypothetical protein [Pseudolabrys sp.]
MNLKPAVAILAIVALPLCAQAQQPQAAPKPTKATAEQVVKIIGGDKAKVKIYCDVADLNDQIIQASEKKDDKKADALADKADELATKLGPEYIALMDGLQEIDPNSKESQDIGTAFDALDALCGPPK